MKQLLSNLGKLTIVVLLAFVVVGSTSCSNGGPSEVEILIVDSVSQPVEGAIVKLTAPQANGKALASYLPDVQTSGIDGKTRHSFPLEAVLTAEVTKGNLIVRDVVRLKREEAINQTIILK